MHQLTLEIQPDCYKYYFPYSSNVHTYFTRNSSNNNLFLPCHSTNKMQNCIKCAEFKYGMRLILKQSKKIA